MTVDDRLENIKNYFAEKLATHGATPRGVDYNSVQSQELRFEQIIKVCDPTQPFSLLDYGCGFGSLADLITRKGWTFTYTGYDVLPAMIDKAIELHRDQANCAFTTQASDLIEVDYAVESGVFNMKLDADNQAWTAYVLECLETMNRLGRKGFGANFLTSYSDPERMRPDLYYADPCFLFDYCKRHFSRNVALLHDYNLYDFTILVRKTSD